MRPTRTFLALFVGATALASSSLLVSPVSATPGEPGSCVSEIVEQPDGSSDLTNEVSFIVGDQFYDVGCVTVNSLPGVRLQFEDAITYPGWTYRVKEAGGNGRRKVSVEFTNPSVPYKITYVIQPGRVDWKVS